MRGDKFKRRIGPTADPVEFGSEIQSTVCACGEWREMWPLPSVSSISTKLPAATCRLSPSLVSYSTLPSSRTVSTGSGTLCQATSRMPAGMRVKRMREAG